MMAKNRITFKVEKFPSDPRGRLVNLYEKVIELDSHIVVPYEQTITSLKFLYGNDVIVSISQQTFDSKH